MKLDWQSLNKFLMLNLLVILQLVFISESIAQKQILDKAMHTIRAGDKPEWDEFKNQSPLKQLTIKFEGRENLSEQTLQIRQYDVKQSWQVLLNGNKLGNLVTDMNDMIIYLSVPPKGIVSGQNTLQILPSSPEPDDISIGEIILYEGPLKQKLNEAQLTIGVTGKKNNSSIPCRITIVNGFGILQMTGASSNEKLAVRPGNIYSLEGKITIGLPAGKYTIYAGRGFEYSVDSIQIVIKPGEHLQKNLILEQEVITKGWISSDPHIHTYTYSRHGDATIAERALSIAGEGIELPIVTDHNIKVDMAEIMKSSGANRFCTPVMGMEFTTNLGHFNVFPVDAATAVPGAKVIDWNSLIDSLHPGSNQVVILNHARDIHNGFRPFGEKRHLAIAGSSLDGWKFPANAMEVVNSGSLQTNNFQLLQDWFGMMNRGYFLTPVGSSDSHDVSRYLVGQARTYIKSDDEQPDHINIDEAIKNLLAGKVTVSLGLFTQITVNKNYGPGEIVPPAKEFRVTVEVSGPAWTNLNHLRLYANGKKIREAYYNKPGQPGLKGKETWVLPKSKQDLFLVAIAEGPYKYLPYWPLVKPFQPVSTKFTPVVIGSTGAVWIDNDGDGLPTCAYQYAFNAWQESNGEVNAFIHQLGSYDEAVAVQAASLLHEKGWSLQEPQLLKALSTAKADIQLGFQNYLKAWSQFKAAQ